MNLEQSSIPRPKIIPAATLTRLEKPIVITTLICCDLILSYLAFRTAYYLRYYANWPFSQTATQPVVDYLDFSLLIIPIWLGIFVAIGLYNPKNLLGGTREYELVFFATVLGSFIIICSGFLFPDNLTLARGWVILTWVFSYLHITLGRFIVRRMIYGLRRQGYFQTSAIVIGTNMEARLIAEQFTTHKTSGPHMVGFVQCSDCSTEKIDGLPCLGTVEALGEIISQHKIGVLILISSALSRGQIISIFEKYGTAQNLDLRMSSGLYEIITTGMRVIEDGMVPMMVVDKVRLTGVNQLLKTVFDYCMAIPAVILLSPLFLVIGLVIKLDSKGPVIYLRQVMGVSGKKFYALKFRTMFTDGDKLVEACPELMEEYKKNFKIKNDPRVTRVGRFLRKTSLDELPQLINVLLNEMSLVGPRMICPDELEKYNHWGINLLTVKPGITGLWQVRGRSDVSYEERVRYDMYYIRNWTPWLDMQIILQTIPAILFRRGAY